MCGLGTDQCRRVFKALKSLSLQTPACPEPPWSAGTFGRCPLPPSALEETQTRPARARARVPPVCCSVQVAADMELVGGVKKKDNWVDVKKKDNWSDLHSGTQQGACARASPRCTCSRSVAEMARELALASLAQEECGRRGVVADRGGCTQGAQWPGKLARVQILRSLLS